MRLWTLHPKYLDSKGLVGLWREALLAQKVLQGTTDGYKNHPQLKRFKQHENPLAAIAVYLSAILQESRQRGYRFDGSKIPDHSPISKIPTTKGQIIFEWLHLRRKLQQRLGAAYPDPAAEKDIISHPIFKIIPGPVEEWEKISS